jgi:ABC-type multidrug transport system fused ATPase/permease subunit
MFSYETGLTIALVIYLITTVNTVVTLNSLYARNLNKVGMRLSRITLLPRELDADFKNRTTVAKVFFWVFFLTLGLLAAFLSWLSVLWFVGTFVYGRMKDSGAPNNVREYRWKLRNVDMTFDQIVAEIVKLNGESSSSFDEVKTELLNGMAERGLI